MRRARVAGDHWSDDPADRGGSNHKDPTGLGASGWGVRFHGPYSLRSVPHYLHREDAIDGLWHAAAGLALLVVPWLFVSWAPVPPDVPVFMVPLVAVLGTLAMVGWPLLLVPALSLGGLAILLAVLGYVLSDALVIGPHNSLLHHPNNPRSRDALRVVVTPGRRGR